VDWLELTVDTEDMDGLKRKVTSCSIMKLEYDPAEHWVSSGS
jgi:hypothetical protein